MPHFFSHISKQKGYYNPDKKHYCKYHTSMDYLQTIVNGFKIKNPYKKDWLPFVSILDNSLFRTSGVNQKQIDKIFNMLKKFVTERKTIYSSDIDSTEDKSERVKKIREDLIAEIESETIGFSTLYRMLSSLEDKENSQIKNVLLDILWLCGNESFNKAIINSSKEILEIQDDGNDINMFGIGFKIAKKQVNSEI